MRRPHRCGGEDAQLGALHGAERAIGAAQHGQGTGLQRRNGQRRDLDCPAVGRGKRGGEVGRTARVEDGGSPGLPDRCARDHRAAVVRALQHEPAVGRDQLDCLLGDALEQAALVELVGEPGRRRQQAIERVGLCAQLLPQRPLRLDVALRSLA